LGYPWTSYKSFIHQRGEDSLVDTGEMLLYFSKGKEIGKYFGIKGAGVCEAIKRIERRLDEKGSLRDRIEVLKEKIITEF
jgi:hypothetical protein